MPAKRLRHKHNPPAHRPSFIPFPFGFPLCTSSISAFFFPVFLLESITKKRSRTGKKRRKKHSITLKRKVMNIIGKLTQDAQVRTTSNNRKVISSLYLLMTATKKFCILPQVTVLSGLLVL